MYSTCMHEGRQDYLTRLDVVLLSLRRLTSPPALPALGHQGVQVEVSTMLVVDVVARAEDCSVRDVADALTVAHSTASRLVDRAHRAGMVTRTRHPVESRRAQLGLTPAGQQFHQTASRFRTDRLGSATSDWSLSDLATLTQLLERFAATAQPHLDPSAPADPPTPPGEDVS